MTKAIFDSPPDAWCLVSVSDATAQSRTLSLEDLLNAAVGDAGSLGHRATAEAERARLTDLDVTCGTGSSEGLCGPPQGREGCRLFGGRGAALASHNGKQLDRMGRGMQTLTHQQSAPATAGTVRGHGQQEQA